MLKSIAVILLIINMTVGLSVWLEDHDNTGVRVFRLGIVIMLTMVLLVFIYFVNCNTRYPLVHPLVGLSNGIPAASVPSEEDKSTLMEG